MQGTRPCSPASFLATALVIGLPTCALRPTHVRHRAQAGRQPAGPAQADKNRRDRAGRDARRHRGPRQQQPGVRSGRPAQAAKVEVTGSATADYLQTGQIVELKAEIDDHGAIKEKVGELTIVSLSSEKHGLFPPESEGKAGEEKGAFGAVRRPGGAASRETGQIGQTRRLKARAIPAGSYRIVGKLMIDRGGKFKVQTDRGKLSFELTEQAHRCRRLRRLHRRHQGRQDHH